MIPPIPRRCIRLYPRILNRHALPHVILAHRYPIQPPYFLAPVAQLWLAQSRAFFGREALTVNQAERLTGGGHAVVLAFELELALAAQLRLVEAPGAVDGPVAAEYETFAGGRLRW